MKRTIALLCAGICVSTQSVAATDQEELASLREQIRILTERLDRLEQDGSSDVGAGNKVSGSEAHNAESIQAIVDQRVDERFAESWTDRIGWKGDFRYRYENIGIEGSDDRNRQRIRARAQLEARINEETTVGFGLATGGFDPVSTNQTLGGGGSSKQVNLNLAYFEWEGLENTRI
ncbi:MAG: putative porin, partial [Xanthomonadales bacterium]|nr:putative porin [Xanthomonadales bacterium]